MVPATGRRWFRHRNDSAVTGAVSPHGLRLDVAAGGLFKTVASEDAPLIQINASKTFVFGQKNVIGFRAQGDTYFRRNVADPFRFTLGGPMRLSASSIDEFRGTDDFFFRGGYLRKIATLPSGLGQGVYLTGAYEAGEIWSPERKAILRQDVVGGIVASTPFGVITLAGSAGDAGRRKVFFMLGGFSDPERQNPMSLCRSHSASRGAVRLACDKDS